VAPEPVRLHEAAEPRVLADDREAVRRVVVEPRPGPEDPDRRETGQEPDERPRHRPKELGRARHPRGGAGGMRDRDPADDLPPHRLAEVQPVRGPDHHRVEERLHRLRREDLVARRRVRGLEARPARELGRPAAGGVDDHPGLHAAARRDDPGHTAVAGLDARHLDPEGDLDAPGPDVLVEAPDRRERVEDPVAGEVRPSDGHARREARYQRRDARRIEHLGGEVLGADQVVHRPQPGELDRGLREEQVAGLAEPEVVAELAPEAAVGSDRLAGQPHGRARLPLLPDAAPVPARGAAREEAAVHHQDRSGPRGGEVVRRVEADDPGADYDRPVLPEGRSAHDPPGGPGPAASAANAASGTGTSGGRWVM